MIPNTIFPNTGLGIVQDYCALDCNGSYLAADVLPIDDYYMPQEVYVPIKTDGSTRSVDDVFYTPEIIYTDQNPPFPIFNDAVISNTTAAAISNNFDAAGNPMETVFIQPSIKGDLATNPIMTVLPIAPSTATETPFTEVKPQTPATANYTVPIVIGSLVGLWFLFGRKKNKVTN